MLFKSFVRMEKTTVFSHTMCILYPAKHFVCDKLPAACNFPRQTCLYTFY